MIVIKLFAVVGGIVFILALGMIVKLMAEDFLKPDQSPPESASNWRFMLAMAYFLLFLASLAQSYTQPPELPPELIEIMRRRAEIGHY